MSFGSPRCCDSASASAAALSLFLSLSCVCSVSRAEVIATPMLPTKASSSAPMSNSQICRISDMEMTAPRLRSTAAGPPRGPSPAPGGRALGLAKEWLALNARSSLKALRPGLHQDLAPARQPGRRIAGGLAADALPQAFAVEAEDGREVGPPRGRAYFADEAVEDQRLGVGARVVGQHHVRLHRAARTAQLSTHIDQAQLRHRHAQRDEAEILGDGEVFAIAGAFLQRLERAGPVVDLAPDLDVFPRLDATVEELVQYVELAAVIEIHRRLQHRLQRTRPRQRMRALLARRREHALGIPGARVEGGDDERRDEQALQPGLPCDADARNPAAARRRPHGEGHRG